MEITKIIVIAILIEAVWENLKMIWDDNKISWNALGVLALSIIICILTNVDLFKLVGFEVSIPFVSNILTGIIVSRGANFVNDLFQKLGDREVK